jgi:hypothetical protein
VHLRFFATLATFGSIQHRFRAGTSHAACSRLRGFVPDQLRCQSSASRRHHKHRKMSVTTPEARKARSEPTLMYSVPTEFMLTCCSCNLGPNALASYCARHQLLPGGGISRDSRQNEPASNRRQISCDSAHYCTGNAMRSYEAADGRWAKGFLEGSQAE